MKVLIYTSPAIGHLFPIMPVALELARRGHAVAVRTLADKVALVRAQGLAAAPIAPAIEAITHDDFLARGPIAALARGVAVFARRAEVEIDDVRAAVADEKPDVVVVDINCWGAAAVAEASRLPWVSFAPYFLPIPSRDAPPFGPGLAPARGPLGRLRDGIVRRVLGRALRPSLAATNAIRARVGLPPFAAIEEVLTAAPRILSFTAEPFEYPRRDWPAAVRLVGPSTWEPPAPAPAWLASLPPEEDRPLVLVSTSSEKQEDGRLIEAALDGLRDEAVTTVATCPAGDPARFRPPPNGRVVAFAPHGALLPRAACVICHGGMGVTQKALAAGVPVVVVPFGRDQLEVARRVEVSGAGVRLPVGRLSPARLRDAVRQARAMTDGAGRVSRAFAAAGGAAAAAAAVEELTGAQAAA